MSVYIHFEFGCSKTVIVIAGTDTRTGLMWDKGHGKTDT